MKVSLNSVYGSLCKDGLPEALCDWSEKRARESVLSSGSVRYHRLRLRSVWDLGMSARMRIRKESILVCAKRDANGLRIRTREVRGILDYSMTLERLAAWWNENVEPHCTLGFRYRMGLLGGFYSTISLSSSMRKERIRQVPLPK